MCLFHSAAVCVPFPRRGILEEREEAEEKAKQEAEMEALKKKWEAEKKKKEEKKAKSADNKRKAAKAVAALGQTGKKKSKK